MFAGPLGRSTFTPPKSSFDSPLYGLVSLRRLSPRVRGNPLTPLTPLHLTGSIPACAGEPHFVPLFSSSSRVYPRVCGGTTDVNLTTIQEAGLSPRVRGNPLSPKSMDVGTGSIPACAGEPGCRTSPDRPHGVYPRVCGGTDDIGWLSLVDKGLSPRVRGNPREAEPAGAQVGSIPACAGEPLR